MHVALMYGASRVMIDVLLEAYPKVMGSRGGTGMRINREMGVRGSVTGGGVKPLSLRSVGVVRIIMLHHHT